jgi:hypothetical protein
MTTPHGSTAPEPDGARRDFVKGTIADGVTEHAGPVFAQGANAPSATGGTTAATGAAAGDGADGVDNDDLDDDDGDFAPRPRQRLGLLSGVLVVALAIALGFLGGEIVQKHYGTTASAAATGANRAAAGFTGREGGAGAFGNAAPGQTGTGTGTGTGAGTTAIPAVIGTVTSLKGTTMVVTNLGGAKVKVHLTKTTTVTVSVAKPALKVGQTVSVAGRTANKIVTATSVTLR